MKVDNVKNAWSGAVSGQIDVIIEINTIESKELRNALAIVDKYKKTALKAINEEMKYQPNESDWHMLSYCVKSDKVIVSVTDGMTG